MKKVIVASLLIMAFAAVSASEARIQTPSPTTTSPVPVPRNICGCESDFECEFGGFGCPGFHCAHYAPAGGRICAPLDP